VTLGSVSGEILSEGAHAKWPLISSIDEISIRTTKVSFQTECYSSDLQQVSATIAIIYSIPESNAVNIYKNYNGNPFEQFIKPQVQEAFKEVTATRSAEKIVKERQSLKLEALNSIKKKVNGLVTIHDIAIENFDLSSELEKAIEQKMVQEQEAARAKFAQEQAKTDAQTAMIRAEGEAKAIKIRGEALRENKELVSLQIVEKWDGKTPQTVVVNGNQSAANILLPIK
jgi:prohibitin 2